MIAICNKNEHIRIEAARLLKEGYAGVVGLRNRWGHIGPFVFTKEEQLEDMVIEPRYPMAMVLRNLLRTEKDKRFGVTARGCDVRAIRELMSDKIIDSFFDREGKCWIVRRIDDVTFSVKAIR